MPSTTAELLIVPAALLPSSAGGMAFTDRVLLVDEGLIIEGVLPLDGLLRQQAGAAEVGQPVSTLHGGVVALVEGEHAVRRGRRPGRR